MGDEITIYLPKNWYEDNNFLGFALFCHHVPIDDEEEDGLDLQLLISDGDQFGHMETIQFFPNYSLDMKNSTLLADPALMVVYFPQIAISSEYRSNRWNKFKTRFSALFVGSISSMRKILLNRAFNYSMSKEAMMIQRITHMSSFQLPLPRREREGPSHAWPETRTTGRRHGCSWEWLGSPMLADEGNRKVAGGPGKLVSSPSPLHDISPFCWRFYTGEHPQSRPQVQPVLALAGVGWCWLVLAGAGWRAGTGASVGAGATSSDDAGATPGDSFHTGSLSPSSTLGSPIDDGCGPELEPRPVCEGEEPHASHLPGPSPP
ncbi:hypothetical protein AAG906_005962 [Vitis piasezkii]